MSAIPALSGTPLFRPAGRSAQQTSPDGSASQPELTPDQARDVRELQKTDIQVRQHEQAHKSAGGPYAGAISYQYATGPDGRKYVTGGEVPIDASPVRGDPEATIAKMEVVKRAALAPAEPSPQDRAVAAQADATRAQAQKELAQERGEDGTDAERAGSPRAAESARAAAAYRSAALAPAPAFSIVA